MVSSTTIDVFSPYAITGYFLGKLMLAGMCGHSDNITPTIKNYSFCLQATCARNLCIIFCFVRNKKSVASYIFMIYMQSLLQPKVKNFTACEQMPSTIGNFVLDDDCPKMDQSG